MYYKTLWTGLVFVGGLTFYGNALAQGLEGKVQAAQDTSKPKQEQVVEQFNFVAARDSIGSWNKQLSEKYG